MSQHPAMVPTRDRSRDASSDAGSQAPVQQLRPAGGRGPAALKSALARTEGFDAQVQMLAPGDGAGQERNGDVHALAKQGTSGGGASLPFAAQIQKSFGRHDVSQVQAHTDAKAAGSAKAMGADAYASGSHVAFGKQPDLHTAAHEAAHVVQQRAGVSLSGGVGQSGDAYEQHADQVADAVVAGKSAEGLLDARAPSGGAQSAATPKSTQRLAARDGAIQMKTTTPAKDKMPQGNEAFQEMWDNHPHAYQEDESQNTASPDLLKEVGLPTDWNTCAIRLSRMFNRIGLKITPAKAKAAGVPRRPYYSKNTKEYLILSAKEMWTYMAKNFRKADVIFPTSGKVYKDGDEFRKEFDEKIAPIVKTKKGIVAFEKIFGYGGTGHVDLFDGMKLSDAPDWYGCQKLHLWYIGVTDDANL